MLVTLRLLDTLTKLAVAKLPKLAFVDMMLPLTSKYPVTFAPFVVTTRTVFPPAEILTFPLATGILKLLVPLLTPDVSIPDN